MKGRDVFDLVVLLLVVLLFLFGSCRALTKPEARAGRFERCFCAPAAEAVEL